MDEIYEFIKKYKIQKIISLFLFFLFVSKPPNFKTNNEYYNNTNTILKEENIEKISQLYHISKNHLTEKLVDKYNAYMNICQKGILLDNKTFNLSLSPKISVIMPLYNGGKYLYYSLRSIQNQKMKDIEIILINDCSTDDTLQIIEKYMKEDPRIKLINNEKNRRILYSKSISALYANGKYILELDQDDMFITDDAFNILYNDAEKNKLDLIQFQDFKLKKFKIYYRMLIGRNQWIFHHNNDIYLKQPDIKYNFFEDFNFLLWGLLIKADIYKKAVHILWPIIINYKFIYYEDYTITFIIITLVNNFKFLNNYFIVHLSFRDSTSKNKAFKYQNDGSILLFANFMLDYYIKYHNEDIKMINNFLSYKNGLTKSSKKIYHTLFNYTFKKIFEYLTYEEKIKYIKKYNLNELKIWNTYEYYMNTNEFNSILFYQNLINKKNEKKIPKISLNPKFSIIIYCTKLKFLEITLNSIQNQNFENYEIILIYDNNKKKEFNKINTLIKDGMNIKIKNNNGKKGLFYSYITGILESKGEYILTIKSGYTLSKQTILDDLEKKLVDEDVDILEFNLLINNNEIIRNDSLKLYKCTHFESEINIDSFLFNKNYKKIDQEKELVVNKLIKSSVYKSVINKYKYFFIGNKMYNYFDELILFLFKKEKIQIRHIDYFGTIEYSKIIKSY